MKKIQLISIIIFSIIFFNPVFSQNSENSGSLGLPGDNLNLYGVLSLFQASATLEEFEQKLNSPDSKINNLDLDGDGKIDYIKVIDQVHGNAHVIVLQDMINAKESQDVAVIEVEKDKNNQVHIQIIGDELLYGKDYIVEPSNGTPNPGYTGNANSNSNVPYGGYDDDYYNSGYAYGVASWSIVNFLFSPFYVVYVSPWRWGFYPYYWHPWHSIFFNNYYGYWHNHGGFAYYHRAYAYHDPVAHSYYAPRRTSSAVVSQRISTYSHSNNQGSRPTNNSRSLNSNRPSVHSSSSVHNSNSGNVAPSRNITNNKPAVRSAANHNARPVTTQRPAQRPAMHSIRTSAKVKPR